MNFVALASCHHVPTLKDVFFTHAAAISVLYTYGMSVVFMCVWKLSASRCRGHVCVCMSTFDYRTFFGGLHRTSVLKTDQSSNRMTSGEPEPLSYLAVNKD
jgi:hypothetical protein